MLGKELKKIRLYSGLTQIKFAKVLGSTQAIVSKIENKNLLVPKNIEKILNKMVNKEYKTILTNKVFSRELFLKDMLTGNKVIDDIYINATWLKEFDNQPVHSKGSRIMIKGYENKNTAIRNWEYKYVLIGLGQSFYCKERWIK